MALQLKFLFPCFDLCDKVIMYVKDEGAKLNIFTNVLTNIVSCAPWLLVKLYVMLFFSEFLFSCNYKNWISRPVLNFGE
jgi:hypothetical protein